MSVGACVVGFLTIIPLLIGLALVAVGGLSQYYFGNVCQESLKLSIGYFAIIVGVVIVLLTVINMAIQCADSPGGCSIVMVGFTFVIILGVGAILIFAGLKKSTVINNTEECITGHFSKYNQSEETRQIVDHLQQRMKCCGDRGAESYLGKVPRSCCKDQAITCNAFHPTVFKDGCTGKLLHQLNVYYPLILGLVGAVFGILVDFYSVFSIVNS